MSAVISSHWTIKKTFLGRSFFVMTAVVVLNFTEVTCWNINNIQAASRLYLNNTSHTSSTCRNEAFFLNKLSPLTSVELEEFPQDICLSLSLVLQPFLLSVSSHSTPCFKIPFSLHQINRISSLDISQHSLLHNSFHFSFLKTVQKQIFQKPQS